MSETWGRSVLRAEPAHKGGRAGPNGLTEMFPRMDQYHRDQRHAGLPKSPDAMDGPPYVAAARPAQEPRSLHRGCQPPSATPPARTPSPADHAP